MPQRSAPAFFAAFLLVACGDTEATTGGGGAGTGGDVGSGGEPGSGGGGQGEGGTVAAGGAPSGGGGTASTGGGGEGGGGTVIGCLTDVAAGHHEVTCDGGIAYDVEIPSACVQGGCGLIVDLHGYTMTGDSEDENTGMRALGQANGYVVVQPTAPKDNLQQPSWEQATHVPLVCAFLSDLAGSLDIDPARIHAMGFSQGGGMTLRLLCTHADFFASGAPIGALEGCEFEGANAPSEEVDILQVHGHSDAVVSFDAVAIPQRDAILGGFSFGAPSIIEQDAGHTATRWLTPSATVFEFWEHDYETSATVVFVGLDGHCVPGGDDFDGLPAGYSCEDVGTFVFGELAMQFFLAHPKG